MDDERLNSLRAAFMAFAAKNGSYPRGSNSQIVNQLADPKQGVAFVAKYRDSRGSLINADGQPFVFLFSAEGHVLITTLTPDNTAAERQVLLLPYRAQSNEEK